MILALPGIADPVLRVFFRIGMREVRRHFGDTAIIGYASDRTRVLETRRTEDEPLSLEDGDTAFGGKAASAAFQDGFQGGHDEAPWA
ncbi:hypothetical protein [Phreatobacter sp. AB_2022a]|uniref:hypothetical protein n=1 Tax=Phreatobacter sp. AB_2022a TaxID=3003134 RepID=UPI002E1DDC72